MPEYTQARLDAITAQIAELSAERRVIAKEVGAPLVQERFAALFHFPGVFNARFTAYTPYFNDGDPCEFSVYADLSINGDSDNDEVDEELTNAIVFSTYDINRLSEVEVDEPNPYAPGGKYRDDPFKQGRYYDTAYWDRQVREWDQYKADQRAKSDALRALGWNADLAKQFDETITSLESWLNASEDFIYDAFGDHIEVIVSAEHCAGQRIPARLVVEYSHSAIGLLHGTTTQRPYRPAIWKFGSTQIRRDATH